MRVVVLLIALFALSCGQTSTDRPQAQDMPAIIERESGFSPRVNMYLTVTPRLPEATSTVEARGTASPTAVVSTFRVSCYSISEAEGTGDRTATGAPTSRGVMATGYERGEGNVITPHIPLGTTMRFEKLGDLKVEDTCPACKEGWVDVYGPDRDKCFEFGVQYLTATVLYQPANTLQIER